MSGGFAVDIPVTNLDEDGDIDEFRIQDEEIDNENSIHHDLDDFQFNNRSNILSKGWNTICRLFPKKYGGFQSLAEFNFSDDEYNDNIELMNRNGSVGSDLDFNFDQLNKRKGRRCKNFLTSKLFVGNLLAIIIGLLITVIVLSVKFSDKNNGIKSSESENDSTDASIPNVTPSTTIVGVTPTDSPKEQNEAEKVSEKIPGDDSELSPKKLTVVIAIDGLNPHYISESNMPFLNNLLRLETTVYSKYLKQVNPANDLSNIWSLSTGLYPGEHGIIDNMFYDPVLHDTFKSYSTDEKWWIGESVWERVHKAGMKILTFNWLHIISNKEHISYHEADELKEQVIQLEYYLNGEDLNEERYYIPNLLLMKVNSLGHVIKKLGKLEGKLLSKELNDIDVFLETVYMLIEKYEMLEYANIMIVSEGSYVPVDSQRIIQIDDLVESIDDFTAITGSSIVQLYPQESILIEDLPSKVFEHEHISIISNETEIKNIYGGYNQRIAPIVLVPDVGYHINHGRNDVKNGMGNGYLNNNSLSHGVFIATGEYFDRVRGDKRVLKPFDIVRVYGMICESLGIKNGNEVEEWNISDGDNWTDSNECCDDGYPGVKFPIDIINEKSFFEKLCEDKLVPLKPVDNVDSVRHPPSEKVSWWDKISGAVDAAEEAVEEAMDDVKSHFSHHDD